MTIKEVICRKGLSAEECPSRKYCNCPNGPMTLEDIKDAFEGWLKFMEEPRRLEPEIVPVTPEVYDAIHAKKKP